MTVGDCRWPLYCLSSPLLPILWHLLYYKIIYNYYYFFLIIKLKKKLLVLAQHYCKDLIGDSSTAILKDSNNDHCYVRRSIDSLDLRVSTVRRKVIATGSWYVHIVALTYQPELCRRLSPTPHPQEYLSVLPTLLGKLTNSYLYYSGDTPVQDGQVR